ncbi:hypothetical protein [Vibrio sp. M260112]|uniref:hypothetical protein n=1 Tax=Vibrio sp. M260112 TaxID=3020895 RepID=UPI002F414D6F
MTTCTINKENADMLRLSKDGDIVTFSKPSAHVVQASLCSGVFQVICECTLQQISFHFDELSETYFVLFGHGVTIANFTGTQIQRISEYLGFLTCAILKEA